MARLLDCATELILAIYQLLDNVDDALQIRKEGYLGEAQKTRYIWERSHVGSGRRVSVLSVAIDSGYRKRKRKEMV
jgi:hypothetical protein